VIQSNFGANGKIKGYIKFKRGVVKGGWSFILRSGVIFV
jgi:hypothetical protein